jgi:membrane protease YdiL (CAAX protease family)
MKTLRFWNPQEQRLRAGWRVAIQVLLVGVPMALIGASGFFTTGQLALKMMVTALPVTAASVFFLGKFVDRRKFSDFGLEIREKVWWQDYAYGSLVGFLSAGGMVLALVGVQLAVVRPAGGLAEAPLFFLQRFLLSLVAYISIGIFEELLRAYQVRNLAEGLSGARFGITGGVLTSVALAGLWSVLMHASRPEVPFLVYIWVSSGVYGLGFAWTKRAALPMAMHFAWDFTLSSLFQLGTTSEPSLFTVTLQEFSGTPFSSLNMFGIAAKAIGLVLIALWVFRRQGTLRFGPELTVPTLADGVVRGEAGPNRSTGTHAHR